MSKKEIILSHLYEAEQGFSSAMTDELNSTEEAKEYYRKSSDEAYFKYLALKLLVEDLKWEKEYQEYFVKRYSEELNRR